MEITQNHRISIPFAYWKVHNSTTRNAKNVKTKLDLHYVTGNIITKFVQISSKHFRVDERTFIQHMPARLPYILKLIPILSEIRLIKTVHCSIILSNTIKLMTSWQILKNAKTHAHQNISWDLTMLYWLSKS